MQKRTKLQQKLLITGCAAAVLASVGCRSSRPSWNMFSWRNTPSAETLAGAGPTTTYPAPPSESATPEAIASVAGGTASPDKIASNVSPEAPITGFDAAAKSADIATASATNLGAARANGFSVASSQTPSASAPSGGVPDYLTAPETRLDNHSSVPAIPAGYRFGTKATPPNAAPPTENSGTYTIAPSYPAPDVTPASAGTPASAPSAYTMPSAGLAGTTPSADVTSATPSASVASAAPSTTVPSAGLGMPSSAPSSTASAPSSGSFAMPELGVPEPTTTASTATNAQPFTPKATDAITPPTTSDVAGASMPLPSTPVGESATATPASTASSTPSFSTASAELAPRTAPASLESRSSTGGYAPGSTAGSSDYPTTSGYPSMGTGGSYYR